MTTRRQFFATKERKRYYKTIEIYHPSGVLLRYVQGRINPITLGIESTAPRNAGQQVEFIGGAFEYQQPEQNDGLVTADIQLGRVGTQVKQLLKSIRGLDRAKTGEVIMREYIAGQESQPVFVMRLFIRSVTMTAQGVVLSIEQDNPADRNIAEIYTSERFPGTAESI
jgi:hypothetical protein